MKKICKILTSLLIIVAISISCFGTVFASDEPVLRGPKYHYKTEYLSYRYTTVGGYAGNQLPGGYRFPTGGGFYFNDEGGPTASVQVSLSLPAPFNIVTVSASLGNSATSGKFVNVPDTQHYYKLWVEKTLEIRPYKVYRARSGSNNWEYDHSGYVSVVINSTQYAKRVA